MALAQSHWDGVYDRSAVTGVSWFQREPAVSLRLLRTVAADDPIIDVGGGASTLVDRLLDQGYRDVTVLDIAAGALKAAQARLGARAHRAQWITADILDWKPPTRYRVWHDRAVFHFLTSPTDRDRYRAVLERGLAPGGLLIIGTFAADGPTRCSGLPVARYDPSELAREFDGFTVVETVREEHRTPSGHIQPFTWLLASAA